MNSNLPETRQTSAVVYASRTDPFGGRSREEFVKNLQKRLSGRAKAAYIFGSVARGDLHPGSDVDLIIITNTSLPFVERFKEFMDILDLAPAMDLLVYTPEEFSGLFNKPTLGFWSDVKRHHIRVI